MLVHVCIVTASHNTAAPRRLYTGTQSFGCVFNAVATLLEPGRTLDEVTAARYG